MKKDDLHVEIKEPDYYDSPLELVSVEEMIAKQLAEEFDNRCYAAITETAGIVIDKKKLEAALIQDKSRYQEAYQNGYMAATEQVVPFEEHDVYKCRGCGEGIVGWIDPLMGEKTKHRYCYVCGRRQDWNSVQFWEDEE